ncbi:MAG: hypothetical protein J0H42_29755 [Rhizobiales bacterium]|nr:hypothetical protein [Hyphomicrobiales bacterium]
MMKQGQLLDVWERTLRIAPSVRPIALLSLAFPETDADKLAKLSLGTRDAHLLRLRQTLFGDSITCLTGCPACSGELEFAVSVDDLLQQASEMVAGDHHIADSGYRVQFRTPDSTDLFVLSRFETNPNEYQEQIVSRCIIDIQGPNESVETKDLPKYLLDQLTEEMQRRDPLAMIWLDLGCPQCGHAWQSLFDIAEIIWIELDRWAQMLLHEVHLFARAYGWTERDVLQVSPARRAYYLGMIGA